MNTIVIRNSLRNPMQSMLVNPARNWQITPARNWQINPARNWQINPARNWQINPARNWLINPARNMQIDPHRNMLIDPMRSLNIPGYYICSVANNNCYYFTVKTQSQNVFLIFDANKTLCYYAAGVLDCYAVFSSVDMSYVGTLCPNGAGRYNWFSQNGEWLYFFT